MPQSRPRSKSVKPHPKPRTPGIPLIKKQIAEFNKAQKHYAIYARKLNEILYFASKKYAPLAIVQSRAKSVTSFAEKITRKWKDLETNNPVTEFTDLCGARIITLTKSHSDAICKFIEDNFDIDWANCVNAIERLQTSEFGYLSRHYIVSLKKDAFPSGEIPLTIPKDIYPVKGRPMKAEIQVRTILEHAFADVTHDLCYKSSFKVPDKWKRQVAAVAAALETTSNEMEAIVAGIQDYAANYGGTLTPEETVIEIEKLSIILRFDKNNAELAGRIARLAITIGEWKRATDVLQKFVDAEIPAACRDYGIALVKQYRNSRETAATALYAKGQQLLAQASAPEHGDSDAMAEYASSWRRFCPDNPATPRLIAQQKNADRNIYEWYHKAYAADPKNTYALSNVIELEITRRKDLSVISLMRPSIKAALKHCLDQAEVGTNHPWAFYNAALFSMLLDDQEQGLELLAKAIACSHAPFMLESACRTASRIIAALGHNESMELMQQLIAIGYAAKRFSCAADGKKGRNSACAALLPSPVNPFENDAGQVVIVAGDCGTDAYESIEKYRPMILDAFTGYRGLIVSGGTEAGIAEVAGDIDDLNRHAKAIGYLPLKTGAAKVDHSYSVHIRTKGAHFSAREPLQYWQDILSAGIDPATVRVIGIGGGTIAALEYRIALAMGAKVIIAAGSDRATKNLLSDIHWKNSSNLIRLPEEMLTLRYLIKPAPRSLPAAIREDVAKAIHENYRQKQRHYLTIDDPAANPWSKLPAYLKESNRNQADDISEKLTAIGYSIKKSIAPVKKEAILKAEDTDLLARMEHGRWNAEKLLKAWKHGPVKDDIKKTNPCIVKWTELSASDQQKDIDAVKSIAGLLAEVGYRIQKT